MATHADKMAAALRALLKNAQFDLREVSARVAHSDAVEALEAHDARTFANDCHELADRCTVIYRSNPGLRPSERTALRTCSLAAHYVGDDADVAPDLYTEPTA